ncbi:MAG: 2-hydroxyacid dehydrogenase [Hyphomicrobiales bacterium]
MAVALIIQVWDAELWARTVKALSPDLDLRVWPDRMGNPAEIDYAVAWRPPPNVLRSLPNLKLIFSLGAGVDAILSDPTLPENVPIARVIDPDLTMRMTEYVVMQVLMHHRQQRRIEENQRRKIWDSFPTHGASDLAVGILGLGTLGEDAATKLLSLDFKVAGWSRTRKRIPGVHCYAGEAELDAFLGRTDVLVCLLPHTTDTTGFIDRGLIGKLSRKGPFGAPILINAARGKIQVEADILAALDADELHAATLDVFETEPLPPDSPFWTHPKVSVTPHLAADSDPTTIASYALRQIERHEAGLPLDNLIDRARGY